MFILDKIFDLINNNNSRKFQYLLEFPDEYSFGIENINKSDTNNVLTKLVEMYCLKYNLFDNGIIVSLSGGVDSMVIAAILCSLRQAYFFNIYAVHINYNLREESKDEAEFLERFCSQWNINLLVKNFETEKYEYDNSKSRKVKNRKLFEEESKLIRFEGYKELIQKFGCKGVMLGHHQDDIIENIFTNCMRGHNILDIEVMKEHNIINDVNIYRPLLTLRKKIVFNYAHKNNIPYFIDTTPTWSRRGQMRNQIFPLFEQVFTDSWKDKFKEIGTQSNNWGKTVNELIIKPWFEKAIIGDCGFILEIMHTNDANLWCYALPKLFFKSGLPTIKRKSISNLLIKIKQKSSGKINLDSGFEAIILENYLVIYKNKNEMKIKDLNINNVKILITNNI